MSFSPSYVGQIGLESFHFKAGRDHQDFPLTFFSPPWFLLGCWLTAILNSADLLLPQRKFNYTLIR